MTVEKAGHISSVSTKISHFIHLHFLIILISVYGIASVLPQLGLAVRHISLGRFTWFDGGSIDITLSSLMLSFLLFNAGLGIRTAEIIGLRKRPLVIISGFIANMAVPIMLVIGLGGLMHLWHSSDELQNLLVGLALIISMPIAGSSTAWSQNANGNLSLSLGLVFLSTLLSPLTTPLVLNIFGSLTTGDYSQDLLELAHQGTNAFMMLTVVIPSVIGIATHYVLGDERVSKCKPYLKVANYAVLLFLNYSNASTSLPQVVKQPDLDFLVFVCGTVSALCFSAFGAGWVIAKWLKVGRSEQAALMFGLGMNNNGTGLVLAAATMSDHPAVLLPMIFYTLIQQIAAALVDWKMFKNES